MELWHFWIIIGILLFIFEIFTPGFVLASFGLSCIFTALAAMLGYGFKTQLIVFCIVTLAIFFSIRPVLKKYFYRFDDQLKTNVHALIGKSGMVIEKIQPSHNGGRVKIGGEDWKAQSLAGEEIEVGENVIIRKIEGVTVFVDKEI